MKKIVLGFLSAVLLSFPFVSVDTVHAKEIIPNETNQVEGYLPVVTDKKSPYYVDQYGNILDEAPSEGTYVHVLYDSRWDTSPNARTTVYQYININNIQLKGSSSGHYSIDWYNTRINVGMTVYWDSKSYRVTKIENPSILSYNCPLLSAHSEPWITTSVSGGRAVVKGYITYLEPYKETLTGSGSWGLV
ncbi:hypothetical protein WKT02_14000 [Erysipelotrichaceae bacterium HCN-30851]